MSELLQQLIEAGEASQQAMEKINQIPEQGWPTSPEIDPREIQQYIGTAKRTAVAADAHVDMLKGILEKVTT